MKMMVVESWGDASDLFYGMAVCAAGGVQEPGGGDTDAQPGGSIAEVYNSKLVHNNTQQ